MSVYHLAHALKENCTATFSGLVESGDFTDSMDQPLWVEGGTMWHLVYHHLQPLCSKHGRSYVDFIADTYTNSYALHRSSADDPKDHCGRAKFFVSCAMKTRVVDVVAALESWCRRRKLNPKRVYVWMSALCTNQATSRTSNHARALAHRIASIRTFLSVLSPWSAPIYAQRLWCLYEYHVALQHKRTIDVVLTPDDTTALGGMLTTGEATRATINTLVSTTASQDAVMSDTVTTTDRDAIQAFIEQHGGYTALDAVFKSSLYETLLNLKLSDAKHA